MFFLLILFFTNLGIKEYCVALLSDQEVYPNMKILSSFTHPQVTWVSFTQKKMRNKQLPVALTRIVKKKHKTQVNCLVTNILQNIILCVQQKKLIQVWNKFEVE